MPERLLANAVVGGIKKLNREQKSSKALPRPWGAERWKKFVFVFSQDLSHIKGRTALTSYPLSLLVLIQKTLGYGFGSILHVTWISRGIWESLGDLGILESHEQFMQSFWKSTGFKNAHKIKHYIFVSTWYRTCSLWGEWNLTTVRGNPSLKGLFNPILPVHFSPSLNKNVSYHPWGSVLTTCRKEIFD